MDCLKGFLCAGSKALLLALLWQDAAGLCGQAPAADAPARSAAISRTSRSPVIDGVLGDAAWQEATVLKDFTQRVPYSGQKAADDTVVQIMRDDHYIYVGAYMHQDPKSISRNKIRRHDNLPQDDTIEVIFDTFHDHLRGYIFLTNPNGAKHDTQVDGFKGFNNNWDEVWDVRASLQPDGWCAEFRIPVRVLRFQPGRDVWGFNVQRRIQYKQEWDYWSAVPTQYDVSHLGYAGNLSGFSDLAQQRNLQAIPALVPTRLQAEGLERAQYDVEPSLDVKYVLGSNMTLDLTANTDFAQVEADETQVNLTRFSLFFPEKREFFLESASVFDFGVAADTQLFFSRRIGIANGHEVPIFGGARLTGKASRFDVGIMNMQTKESPDQPATNYSVVRLRRGLHGRSTVGAIFTNADNSGYENRAFGLDTSLWLTPTLQFKGFVASALNRGTAPDGTAHVAALDYQTDPWGLTVSEKTVSAGFDPGIGYVRRRDIRSFESIARRRHRLNRRWSRNIDFTAGFSYLTDTDGRLLTRFGLRGSQQRAPLGSTLWRDLHPPLRAADRGFPDHAPSDDSSGRLRLPASHPGLHVRQQPPRLRARRVLLGELLQRNRADRAPVEHGPGFTAQDDLAVRVQPRAAAGGAFLNVGRPRPRGVRSQPQHWDQRPAAVEQHHAGVLGQHPAARHLRQGFEHLPGLQRAPARPGRRLDAEPAGRDLQAHLPAVPLVACNNGLVECGGSTPPRSGSDPIFGGL